MCRPHPIEGVAPNSSRSSRRSLLSTHGSQLEFDVCEIAPTTYIMARALGAPFVCPADLRLARLSSRWMLVRPDANIRDPKDLEGKKVGVRAYSVTTGVGPWHLIDVYGS